MIFRITMTHGLKNFIVLNKTKIIIQKISHFAIPWKVEFSPENIVCRKTPRKGELTFGN